MTTAMQSQSNTEDIFLSWFKASGGELDPRCLLTSIDGMGRGLLATEDIQKGETLFVIPRPLLLNLQTTALHHAIQRTDDKQAVKRWSELQDQGWAPLILAMMWEDYRASVISATEDEGEEQSWGPYFMIMPDVFSTPMFWSDADLEHLKGTSIENKLGREEAEAVYGSVASFVESLPEVFGVGAEMGKWFSLERYHIMASRILSRSFHVEKQSTSEEKSVKGIGDNNDSNELHRGQKHEQDEDDSDAEQEERENVGDISMVPMADMLNAQSGNDNARLSYKPKVLEMRATRDILAGRQIFNTYANPPNSDLLRRYGHVDEPNDNDIVEIDAGLICADIERLQWACETVGIDEVFSLALPYEVDNEMIVLAKVTAMTKEEFGKAVKQETCPSPSLTVDACQLIIDAVTKLSLIHI